MCPNRLKVVADDLGRPAISRASARTLIAERAADEVRRREVAARLEREAIARDEERKANVWAGLPKDRIPVGMTATEAMLQAAAADRPMRRKSMLEESLDGKSMTFHSLQSMPDAS